MPVAFALSPLLVVALVLSFAWYWAWTLILLRHPIATPIAVVFGAY